MSRPISLVLLPVNRIRIDIIWHIIKIITSKYKTFFLCFVYSDDKGKNGKKEKEEKPPAVPFFKLVI